MSRIDLRAASSAKDIAMNCMHYTSAKLLLQHAMDIVGEAIDRECVVSEECLWSIKYMYNIFVCVVYGSEGYDVVRKIFPNEDCEDGYEDMWDVMYWVSAPSDVIIDGECSESEYASQRAWLQCAYDVMESINNNCMEDEVDVGDYGGCVICDDVCSDEEEEEDTSEWSSDDE